MRYATARFNQHQRDFAYRIYVTDCLRMATENTAKMSQGAYTAARFYDIINPNPFGNRSGNEMAADIIKRAGIEVI